MLEDLVMAMFAVSALIIFNNRLVQTFSRRQLDILGTNTSTTLVQLGVQIAHYSLALHARTGLKFPAAPLHYAMT